MSASFFALKSPKIGSFQPSIRALGQAFAWAHIGIRRECYHVVELVMAQAPNSRTSHRDDLLGLLRLRVTDRSWSL